jgi:electron transfer flavoprotein beta subunit
LFAKIGFKIFQDISLVVRYMKCLVAIKQVIDPYVTIRVKADHSAVETNNVKMAMNPFDEIAIEEAVRQKEAGKITEIVAVSIGTQACQETLRQALARGADQAVLIETNQVFTPLAIAKILAKIAEQQQSQLVIMGKQAIDDDCNQTGQMLAAILGWGQGTFSSKVIIDSAANNIVVTREIDGGLETIRLKLPAVITTDLRLNEPRYISLPNVMQAKRKPLTITPLSDLGLNLLSNIKTIKVDPPAQRKAGIKVNSVAELVDKLKHVAQVI